jgi:hypothetical protein
MKKPIITSFVLLAFVSLSSLYAQNVVFETMYLKPNTQNLKELRENMKAHNEKYHAEGPYTASTWQVISGEHTGLISWIMGPFTFADLDNRPSDGGHDEDWMGNVMPHTHGMKDGNYWKMWNDFGYMPSEDFQGAIMRVRYVNLKPGKYEEYKHLLSAIQKVYDANSFKNSMGVYDNWSNGGEADLALVWQYPNWAVFDEDMQFWKKYEEVHGDNSWATFWEAIMDYTDGGWTETYQRME